jgi:hypothetical protein
LVILIHFCLKTKLLVKSVWSAFSLNWSLKSKSKKKWIRGFNILLYICVYFLHLKNIQTILSSCLYQQTQSFKLKMSLNGLLIILTFNKHPENVLKEHQNLNIKKSFFIGKNSAYQKWYFLSTFVKFRSYFSSNFSNSFH